MQKTELTRSFDLSKLTPELALLLTTILFLLISTLEPVIAEKLKTPVIPVMDCYFPKHYDLGSSSLGNAVLQFFTSEAWVHAPQVHVVVGSGFTRSVQAEISYGIGAVSEVKTISFSSNTDVIIPRSTTGYPILEIIFKTTANSEVHVDLELVAGSECRDVGTIDPTVTATLSPTPTLTPTATFIPTVPTEITPQPTITVSPTETVHVTPTVVIPETPAPTNQPTITVTASPDPTGEVFQLLLPIAQR